MGTQKVSIRYLIDVAIGNPEPGIVNFNALYTVLQAISEKLALQDEHIEIDSSFCPVTTQVLESKSNVSSERLMDHQVFDYASEIMEPMTDGKIRDISKPRNENDSDKAQQRSVTPQDQQQTDDRKVVFEPGYDKPFDDDILSTVSSVKKDRLSAYRSELRQHIDALNARLGKIENVFVSNADSHQSVECLQQTFVQFQTKIQSLETAIEQLNEVRNRQEQDISACRKKLEHDKLAFVLDGLRQDVAELKETFGRKSKQLKPVSLSPDEPEEDYKMDYSKLENQIIEVRTNVCGLTDQIANIELNLSRGKRNSSVITMTTFQEEIHGIRSNMESAFADVATLQTDNEAHRSTIAELQTKLEELTKTKIDKEEIDELLSEKADYTMLHRKVSVENMDADRRKTEKQLGEITDCFVLNEERVQKQINDIKKFLGDQSLEDMLFDFKIKIDKEFQGVRDSIKRLAEMKPDVESAVTRLRDLTCLSCDQEVVMKAIEMNNLSKFGNAYVSKSISPTVALEIGKLRQSGKIESMDSPLIDMANNFRHSGGMHTIITNEDRVSKTRSKRHS